ncbi:TPR domain protein in aerotolerance operon [Legionella busanensis]|uniref:TPR domain protein in aerotolerance operon n=1 Tax=Legionella busanensis TaxID=190655 RepID=A0A378JQ76_9GAMM|nr:tetratricopeptide repeat protein [Legionella busanensis]STX52838.1 TPR domain protein in aerotolerance operon [Legionella busanensis]
MIRLFKLLLLLITCNSYALTWQDLWSTKDQQGERLMQQGQFKKAQTTFNDPAWRASAAYRAGDYQQAAQVFGHLQTEQGYYNQGNALAHLGKYEDAIKSYNQALTLNPSNKDALYNRRLLEDLLKKQKEKQENSERNKEQQADNKQQDKNQQDKQGQQNKQQNQQNQNNAANQNKDKQNQQQNNNQQPQSQQNQTSQDKQNQQDKQLDSQTSENRQKQKNNDKNEHTKSEQDAAKQNKQDSKKQAKASIRQSPQEQEKEQAKEQWLRLIPDDPGGLLREKFLRDYIRRQHGWYQWKD